MGIEKKAYISIQEVLENAIRFEKDSADFYAEMYKLAQREEVRELLDRLKLQELSHEKALRHISVSVHGDIIQFPPDFDLSMITLESDDPTFDEMVAVAITRERKSVEIYSNAGALATGDLKKLMRDLAKFESVHVRELSELQNR